MRTYDIALLPGDGPGEAIVRSICQGIDDIAASESDVSFCYHFYDMGLSGLRNGHGAIPDSSIDGIRKADAALLGFLDRDINADTNVIGTLRRQLNLYADVRPVKPFDGTWSLSPDIDIVCIRESTEGFLSDRNMFKGCSEVMPTDNIVLSTRVITRQACEKIAAFTFEYARKNRRKKVTIGHKVNVFHLGCGMFLESVKKIGQNYPDIELCDEYIDDLSHNIILRPENYDLIVTTNMFGDIVSDVASALVSGMVPSANIGERNALFCPISHIIKLKDDKTYGEINPLPLFLCAVMMLSYLGEEKIAGILREKLPKI